MAMLRPNTCRLNALCANPSRMSRMIAPLSCLFLSRPSIPYCPPPSTVNIRLFTSSAPPNSDRLLWDDFLRMRRQRRMSGVAASFPASFLGIYAGLNYFGTGEIDPTQTILGFDPFLMNGAFVVGCGILGWLAGPTIGRGIWHLLHRKQANLIKEVSQLRLTI
jgi:hypothetical protein